MCGARDCLCSGGLALSRVALWSVNDSRPPSLQPLIPEVRSGPGCALRALEGATGSVAGTLVSRSSCRHGPLPACPPTDGYRRPVRSRTDEV